MENKTLEEYYITVANQYIVATPLVAPAEAMSLIMYGVELREQEVADLKTRIKELGG